MSTAMYFVPKHIGLHQLTGVPVGYTPVGDVSDILHAHCLSISAQPPAVSLSLPHGACRLQMPMALQSLSSCSALPALSCCTLPAALSTLSCSNLPEPSMLIRLPSATSTVLGYPYNYVMSGGQSSLSMLSRHQVPTNQRKA
jgi:hypothetical protein